MNDFNIFTLKYMKNNFGFGITRKTAGIIAYLHLDNAPII
jgi:hypothetical protein